MTKYGKSGLTVDEQKVMDHITEAWNEYVKLPQQHADDIEEFRHAVHEMQYLLAVRSVRRGYPDYWFRSTE